MDRILAHTAANRISWNEIAPARPQQTPECWLPDLDLWARMIAEASQTSFDAFLWPVSDVVMSLVRAGLRIDEFYEAPLPEMYEGLGDAARRLPAIYVIRAIRD